VDYEPAPALSATTTLQCNVAAGIVAVPAGLLISASAPDNSLVPFEIGTGLADTTNHPVSSVWNDGIAPYWLDDSERCLPRGSTGMWIQGHGYNFLAQPNLALLIQTDLPGESIREVVHVATAQETQDLVYPTLGQPTKVTYITWDAADALVRDHNLTATHLAGNLLPATQGQRFHATFAIGTPPATASSVPSAIARRGRNGTDATPNWIFRYPLSQGRLAWLAPPGEAAFDPSIDVAAPEVQMTETVPTPQPWGFVTSLLDAQGTVLAFTVDSMAWRVVSSGNTGDPVQWEYDGDQGDTLRFGDGVFGLQPAEGTLFDVRYRVGLGAAGNVAADSITVVGAQWSGYVTSARNPFIVTGGADAETTQHIQRMAPQAFRVQQYRAVRPEDYEAAAETLPWVLKASTAYRWTGSWLTVFTTVDPSGNETATADEQVNLINLLNRQRLAGYESYAPSPTLVSIDLRIKVCVAPGWLASDVEAGVLTRLGNATRPDGSTGFFFADRFSFGTPLYRSRLEAAIQGVAGVAGVLDIEFRLRGATTSFGPLPEVLPLAPDEILRVDNDPDYPARGTIRVIPEGGQ